MCFSRGDVDSPSQSDIPHVVMASLIPASSTDVENSAMMASAEKRCPC